MILSVNNSTDQDVPVTQATRRSSRARVSKVRVPNGLNLLQGLNSTYCVPLGALQVRKHEHSS